MSRALFYVISKASVKCFNFWNIIFFFLIIGVKNWCLL